MQDVPAQEGARMDQRVQAQTRVQVWPQEIR